MVKASNFFWAWNNNPLRADPLMTRARAARLLSAWRNRPAGCVNEFDCARIGRHEYRVVSLDGTFATMAIRGAK